MKNQRKEAGSNRDRRVERNLRQIRCSKSIGSSSIRQGTLVPSNATGKCEELGVEIRLSANASFRIAKKESKEKAIVAFVCRPALLTQPLRFNRFARSSIHHHVAIDSRATVVLRGLLYSHFCTRLFHCVHTCSKISATTCNWCIISTRKHILLIIICMD